MLSNFLPPAQLRMLAGSEHLNMTCLGLRLSGFVKGVARRHAETAKRMCPGFRIGEITNGVHIASWAHPAIAQLPHGVAPSWAHEPEELVNADRIGDAALFAAHRAAKAELTEEVAVAPA